MSARVSRRRAEDISTSFDAENMFTVLFTGAWLARRAAVST
jgi:hypothetical protein